MVNFQNYLTSIRSQKDESYTHTRIGSKELNIYGGKYNVENTDVFYKNYYDNTFVNHHPEYLTEKQLIDNGPILLDIDLRYDTNVTTRLHTTDHIIDLIFMYMNKLSEIYNIDNKTIITVYVTQRDNIIQLEDKTKDGIHIVICFKSHKAIQSIIRTILVKELQQMWDDLPVTNTYEEIIDEGVVKGLVNWQLYGSQKPGCLPYKLTNTYNIIYDKGENSWDFVNKSNKLDNLELLKNMSARNDKHITFTINDKYLEKYEKEILNLNNRELNKKKREIKNKVNLYAFDFSKINNEKLLDELIEELFDDIKPIDYELKESHEFTMILPDKYYGEGSYNNWIKVGWALKNTDIRLFLTWIKMSSKAKVFDYGDIPKYYDMWKQFDYNNPDGLTNKSIMYWAKIDNYQEYKKIRQETIDYFIEETIEHKPTEFDLANVLYHIYKDEFVCVSIKNNIWYEYIDYKWTEIDSGNTLRLLISKNMHAIYIKKVNDIVEKMLKLETNSETDDKYRSRSHKLTEVCVLLKTTSWKNNIMREAKELFYDKNFTNKLDSNPYLLCFNNYVIDFKNKIHRKGQPDDYISKSTNIDYVPCNLLNSKSDIENIKEVKKFVSELFPEKELEEYMWQHLASCLIGTNENQTFNIYTGSGANGKSKLVELMSKCLGDYKATVPITLLTQSRPGIGNTSSEVVQLMGIRYAVMQEPSKGDKINEGIMKEITGGDPIQGRALFKDAVTFIPQFKLVACTNTLMDIRSNDDGTWRRIRVCDFMSKFIDEPFMDLNKFPRENYPHQFRIDRKIDEKFIEWAPIFISLLVDIAFKTGGRVTDCHQVLAVSDKYRESQDYLAEFAREKIQRTKDKFIKKTEILEEFKNWYIMQYGRNSLPNGREITEFMDKTYGKCNRGKWHNVEIIYEDFNDDNIY